MPIPYEQFRPVSRLWVTMADEPCRSHVSGEVLNIKPVPVEVQRLQELLFEHSGALPEGAYLEAMDCLKALADRRPVAHTAR
eukprot:COSAG01_NODE_809_length_13431_cov_12.268677_5_plen_82_part_00